MDFARLYCCVAGELEMLQHLFFEKKLTMMAITRLPQGLIFVCFCMFTHIHSEATLEKMIYIEEFI